MRALSVLTSIEEILPHLLMQAASQCSLSQTGKFTVKFGCDVVEDIQQIWVEMASTPFGKNSNG